MLDLKDTVINVICEVTHEDYLPLYATSGSVGADLFAAISSNVIIEPGTSMLIPTGLKLQLPEGYELQIRPRSGLALKSQITVLNSPGTIDSDYRGEIKIILINHGKKEFIVQPKMRIAQAVISSVKKAVFTIGGIDSTIRGQKGFGHTGE